MMKLEKKVFISSNPFHLSVCHAHLLMGIFFYSKHPFIGNDKFPIK